MLGFVFKAHWTLLKHSISVLLGMKTWVSYMGMESAQFLPKIKSGVFKPGTNWQNTFFERNWLQLYAREYSVTKDLQSIIQAVFKR